MKLFKLKFEYSISFSGAYSVKTKYNSLYYENEGWGRKAPRLSIDDNSFKSYIEYEKALKELLTYKVPLTENLISLIEKTFDDNNIWNWPKNYNKASGFGEVFDGDLWELDVKIDEKKIKSYGACCYPKGYKKLMKMFSSIFNMDFDKILKD